MVSIINRILRGTVDAVIKVPFGATAGALGGYVYARLADLPVNQVAKAWAIWVAAQNALVAFVEALIEDKTAKEFVVTSLSVISTAVAVTELKKRDLIGHKMVIFLIMMHTLNILGMLGKFVDEEEIQAPAQAQAQS